MKKIYKNRHQPGQSLIIIALAMMMLIAFVGLAVDVGLVYIERVRVRRAADAAALAAASDLPLELAAQVRSLEYLQENDYACGLTTNVTGGALSFSCTDPDVRVEINEGYTGQYISGPASDDAKYTIQINTIAYRDDVYLDDSANRIEVVVSANVGLYFMRVFGFNTVSVAGRAVGENINNLDVVLVFDRSGSMEFDTLCYGCWTDNGTDSYPDGDRWPLPWNGPANGQPYHCSGAGSDLYTGHEHYIIIEAEEYSRNSVSYDRDSYTRGMSYWVLQRNGGTNRPQFSSSSGNRYLINDNGAGALGRDVNGAYMSHHPYYSSTAANCTWSDLNNGEMCSRGSWALSLGGPFPAPRLDYDFQVTKDDTWYVWARGNPGAGDYIFYGKNGTPIYSDNDFGSSANRYNGADKDVWEWEKLGSLGYLTTGNNYTLNIWAGGAGFDLDRIIITTDSDQPRYVSSSILNNTANLDNNRTDLACNVCDARFGGYPGGPGGNQPPNCQALPNPEANYRYLDAIYDDEQPIRGAKEASKRFIQRLDPAYDQIGFVSYSSRANIDSELQCVRRLGSESCTSQVITNTVVSEIDSINAGGSTNIAEGILKGINVLSNQSGHYGRPAAAHIMIVMTDGESNQTSGLDGACDDEEYWPADSTSAKDCVVYYARQARDNGIVIYSITLGDSADIELMQYIAELTGGVHRHAPRPEQLDPIFDELYKRIFLRLVE